MWEFLKSKARKERELIESEKIKQEEIDKKIEEDRIEALYLIENKRLNDKLASEIEKYDKKEKKRIKKANEICPKCKSTKVVDKISQLKGEINGSSYNSSSFGLLGGSSYGSGSIHGSMDTLEINKCNECGNEWKKTFYNNYSTPSWENNLRFLRIAVNRLHAHPEEKEVYFIKDARDFWTGTSIELFQLFVERQYLGYSSFLDDYYRQEFIVLIKDKYDILVNKLGFIK